jgi:hypothetical protein
MAGGASFQQKGSCEWFFRGNKLMLSSRMKKHLKEICGCVLPEIPFFLYQMNKSNLKPNGRMVSFKFFLFGFVFAIFFLSYIEIMTACKLFHSFHCSDSQQSTPPRTCFLS